MDDPKPIKLQAYKISCGHAVLKPDEVNKKNLYIKAERKGADYIHHYLIQIGFFKTNNLSLIYIDPEENLILWQRRDLQAKTCHSAEGLTGGPDWGAVR